MAFPWRWLGLPTLFALAGLVPVGCATGTGYTGVGGGGASAPATSSATGVGGAGSGSSSGGPSASSGVTSSGTSASSTSASTSGGPCSLAHLVISEIRSRGAAGANDEFVELYNPTAAAVALDTTWKLEGRKPGSGSYTTRWTGSAGKSIPAHGHFLLGNGSGYTQAPAADDKLGSGVTDTTSLRLVQDTTTVDAVCYYAAGAAASDFDGTFTCEGTPVSNAPHTDAAGAASDVDASLARKPCTDTGNSAADFVATAPAAPQGATSP
jgi:hypothetical protein